MSSEQNSLSLALIQHDDQLSTIQKSTNGATSPSTYHHPVVEMSPTMVYGSDHHHYHHHNNMSDHHNLIDDDWQSACQDYSTIQKCFRALLQKNDKVGRQLVLERLPRDILQAIENNRQMVEASSTEHNGLFNKVLLRLLRLSNRCPVVDIKETFKNLLIEIQQRGIRVPNLMNKSISSFIPNKEIPSDDTSDDQTYGMFVESFYECGGRLEHMVMVMGMHSQYLRHFLDTSTALMQAKGTVTSPYRYYIGIMAAARHRCPYLVHLMEVKFLYHGGDKRWLKGIKYAPAKLQALSTINKYLAHRPWLVTMEHIKSLCQGERDKDKRWQMSDLVQAIVLLCHFHSLAGFCHSTGLNFEIDHDLGHDFRGVVRQSPSSTDVPCDPFMNPNCCEETKPPTPQTVDHLLKEMERIREKGNEQVTSYEERYRHFEKEKSEASRDFRSDTDSCSGESVGSDENDIDCSRFVEDPNFTFQEFNNCAPTFRALEYNWEDNAYNFLVEFYSEVADLLKEKFKFMRSLTYKTLACENNVDTSSLRGAIWMYIHCMYGIMYDDYNYGEVHHLLENPLKRFIRTVSSVPENTTKSMYDKFWCDFRHSEKVHVSVILLEARLQVGLLYGMRALQQCFHRGE